MYLLHRRNAPLTALWADDGTPAALRDADEAAAIAAAFSNTAVRAKGRFGLACADGVGAAERGLATAECRFLYLSFDIFSFEKKLC